MLRLEDITDGARITGIEPSGAVKIVEVTRHGSSVVTVAYRTEQGTLDQITLYRDSEPDLALVEEASGAGFDASADDVKLASEAYRIKLAHLFDPYLAVRTSSIEPLPHQISAVYQEMMPRMPLRYVLADDPGAGKTVMTGLLIKEMMVRGDLRRCLVVCPGNLAEQWQDELYQKFGLKFTILNNQVLEGSVFGNAFQENDLCIARLDKLARNDDIQQKLSNSTWDLVVVDEAHKMSATVFGNEVKYTKRYHLGQLLGDITENLLLLTATPHNGKMSDFMLFMSLIDRDRFEGAAHFNKVSATIHPISPSGDPHTIEMSLPPLSSQFDVSDVMRRLVKEELLTFEGKPLFPERRAVSINYELSPAEEDLYQEVTSYVNEEFNRADRLLDNKRRNSVGFALTTLQRRLASSPEAIYQSLRRRVERLEERLANLALYQRMAQESLDDPDGFDEDDYTPEEMEDLENEFVDSVTAAATKEELELEIATLKQLRNKADSVRKSGQDKKWDELSKLLQENAQMFGEGGREKLIIFTEHKDTLNYLASKIRSLLGDHDAVITIQGGMSREDRHSAEESFKQDKHVRILIATDAAGEGINLQRAHLMVNYDLPWNPNRLEQRFGRIHRIGQREVCTLWNLVAANTREGLVFDRLFRKLEEERQALGGKVFDILGRLDFGEKSLRDLLLEAIRYGEDPAVKARLDQVVDTSFDPQKIKEIIDTYALTDDMMNAATVSKIREEMERKEARKLEPHFIEAFFVEAISRLGGKAVEREEGRYEVRNVPNVVRNKAKDINAFEPVVRSYERICFTKEAIHKAGFPDATLVAPGHALLDAVVEVILDQKRAALKRGTILIDDSDFSEEPRILATLESAIRDGSMTKQGQHKVVFQNAQFVEVFQDGSARFAGYAPYLDYRAPSEAESAAITKILSQDWLSGDHEAIALDYAMEHLVPKELSELKARREAQVDKVSHAVKKRLEAEINYWDNRAWELSEKEKQGKKNAKLNSENARRRADELAERMDQRLGQLSLERKISAQPVKVISTSLVIPIGLIWKLQGSEIPKDELDTRRRIEAMAMRAVAAIEKELGNSPLDVTKTCCGFDIDSSVPPTSDGLYQPHRFIEVKGHSEKVDTVTISKNEILTALNSPEQHILAIVEVDGYTTRTIYLQKCPLRAPSWAEETITFSISKLISGSQVILEKEESWQ